MRSRETKEIYSIDDLAFLKIKNLWRFFWSEHPAYWFICGYVFFEYFRPQSIYPQIDILPWAQLLLIGAFGLSFFDRKSKFEWNSFSILFVLFITQIHLSFITAYDISWSHKYHDYFYQWIIIYFVIIVVITTPQRFYLFLMVFLVCSIKLSLGTSLAWAGRGFWFTNWGLMGPPGYFQNSGELSIQMLIQLALVIYLVKLFWQSSKHYEKTILTIALVTPILTVLGASSRGSQLAMAVMLIIALYRSIFNFKLLVILIVSVVAIFNFLPEEQKARFETMGGDRTSQQRFLYWKNGIEMLNEHPITGVGYYNFIPYYSDFYPNDVLFLNSRGERVAELPHNILIQVGTDAGWPALLIYCLMAINLMTRGYSRSSSSELHKGLSLGVIGFFMAGQFVTVAYYPYFWISAALLTNPGARKLKDIPSTKHPAKDDKVDQDAK